MRSGGKTVIRGRLDLVERGPVLSAIIHEELRSNPEALKTLEALKAAGVDQPTALMAMAIESAACTRLRWACLRGGPQ